MVNEVFKELIGNTIEVYVDDMLVKSLDRTDHVKHLEQAFALLRKFNVKLNPKKCNFGVASDNFSDTWSLSGELNKPRPDICYTRNEVSDNRQGSPDPQWSSRHS